MLEAETQSLSLLQKPEKLYDNSTNGKFIYIRHGETEYNVKIQNIGKEIAGVDPIHLDLPLNEKGIQQSLGLSEKLKNFKIQIVFTSPLKRCLETAYYALKDHPRKQEFKIVICPFLTETVHSTHDYSVNILKKKDFFSKKNLGLDYDWSLFEEIFPELGDQEFYYLKFIDTIDETDERNNLVLSKLKENINALNELENKNNENKENLSFEIKEKYEKELLSRIQTDLGDLAFYYFRIYRRKPESLNHMFNRNLKCKELFAQISQKLDRINYRNTLLNSKNINGKNEDEQEKVLVFTHSAFIKISTSHLAYEMKEIKNYPEDCVVINNCGMISMNI